MRPHSLRKRQPPRARVGGEKSRAGLAVVAAALALFFELYAGDFLTLGNINSILLNSAPVLIVGIAAAALLISGNIDLSIGGMYGFLAVVTALIARDTQDTTAAVLAVLAIGTILGFCNGLLVQLLNRVSPIIITIGTGLILRGLAFVISDAQTIFGLPSEMTRIGRAYLGGVAVQVWIAVAFFVVVSYLLVKTIFGLRTFAIGGNATAARLNGIPVRMHVTALYAFSGFSVALVAFLTTAQLGTGAANTGVSFEFDVLTAVILGGVGFAGGSGRPVGIFIGVATVGILDSGLIFVGVEDFYQMVAKGSVLLLALAADQIHERREAARPQRTLDAPAPEEPVRLRSVDGLGTAERKRRPPGEPILVCRQLSKFYGAVVALQDVNLEARSGEVMCLLGDNGAGKSTLIKIISGVIRPDAGSVHIRGKPFDCSSPAAARRAGIATAYQDLALCPNLGSAFNLVLGAEPRGRGLGVLSHMDVRATERLARERMKRLGVELHDYFLPIEKLSGGQRQCVAIARVADDEPPVVILDEPTAALGVNQSQNALRLIRGLADGGTAVILITHDVDTAVAVGDRVTVLKLGATLFAGDMGAVTESDLIHLMAGFTPRGWNSKGPDRVRDDITKDESLVPPAAS
jgi:ribose/xylose/arabinose/galactoside ABC-type transport system permease subunit/ABC-type multidrug transport system ATPase subunit